MDMQEAEQKIDETVTEAQTKAKSLVDGVAETIKDTPNRVKKAREDAEAQAKETVDTVKKKAKALSDDVKGRVEDVRGDIKETYEKVDERLDGFLTHQRNAVGEIGKALQSLIPEATKEHGQTAVKESIEGYRKLFNGVIDEVMERLGKFRLSAEAAVNQETVAEEAPEPKKTTARKKKSE